MITLGLQADGNGDDDALLHAAAEFVRKHIGHLWRQPHPGQQTGHLLIQLALGELHAVICQAERNLVADAHAPG